MQPPRVAIGLTLLLSAAALIGCSSLPSAEYRVTLPQGSSGRVLVRVDILGAPRTGLTLRSYSEKEVMGVSHLEAADGLGRRLPCQVGYRQLVAKGKTVDVPFVRIPGPLPSHIRLTYDVTPVRREGDDHTGFTGTCFGAITPRFALLTGRNLFLVPDGLRSSAVVRFALPAAWTAVTTWRRRGDTWIAGAAGLPSGEALVSGTIGLGRFREHAWRVRGTEYRI